jgi:thiamine transport system substrate-binding protein
VTLCCKVGVGAVVGALALAAVGCGGSDEAAPKQVVLVTHDSFAVSKPVKRAFERETGLRLRILQSGDAGEALNKALLTAGNPQGDVFFGVDNTLLSRALGEDLFDAYESPELAHVPRDYVLDGEHRVTPIDHGDVCLNYDKAWFRERGIRPPQSLEDLAELRYRNLLVVENPATSTPGLAFLLATVAHFGPDGWQDYWRQLRANGVLVVDGWEEAYTVRFSGSAGKGKRPIVVSYASSPPAEVVFAGRPLAKAPTAVIEPSCFRQVELAGVLRGARNAEGARRLIDFMLSPTFQRDVPLSMFVFPVREGVALPPAFAKHAVVPEAPLDLPPDVIGANRDAWIDEWTDIVLR